MSKIKYPVIEEKEVDVDFNKVWEEIVSDNGLYEDDGRKAFTTIKQLIDYLEEDFEMNCVEYMDSIFHITDFDFDLFDEYNCYQSTVEEYKKFIKEKFKGVKIKDIYNAHPYKKYRLE